MPDWRGEIAHRLVPLRLSPAREESVITELAQHLDQHYADLLAEGMPEENARKAVLAGLEDADLLRELRKLPQEELSIQPGRAFTSWDDLRLDLRFGLRMLRKSPGFSTVAILTLALGIGANTAIFTLVNSVLLEPLPFKHPDQIVLIRERIPKIAPIPIQIPAPDLLEFAASNRSFETVAGYRPMLFELSGGAAPQVARVIRASANLMPMLGVAPALGRSFSEQEENSNQRLALLNYVTWQRQFGSDPTVVGRDIYLDRLTYTVIGVMPRGFDFPLAVTGSASRRTDVWVPLSLTASERSAWADNFDYNAIGRLRDGVSLTQANEDVQRVIQGIRVHYPAQMRDLEISGLVIPLREQVVGGVRTLLSLLLGAVACVLLIACANLANLLMARAVSRGREMAIRRALGATATRVASQLLVESLLLAGLGTIAGVLLATLGTRLLMKLIPAGIPLVHPIAMDLRVLTFAAGLAVLTALLFGAAPAISTLRMSLNESLKKGPAAASPERHRRFRDFTVVVEIALAMMLLASAGLLLRSFAKVRNIPTGVDSEGVLTADIRLPLERYHPGTDVVNFFAELCDRLQHLPGVVIASASTDLPLETAWTRIFTVEGQVVAHGRELNLDSHTNTFGDYFRAMGIPLLRGRAFTVVDSEKAAAVVIVSQSLAHRFWPNQNPIGKRLKWGGTESSNPWLEVVGVVGDVKQGRLDQETKPHTYTPYSAVNDGRPSSIQLRVTGDPEVIVADLRRVVAQLDAQLALSDVRTMEKVIDESTAPRRSTLLLLLLFAGSALLLAAVGVYGVVAYSVAQRTREIGIRMALGAKPSNVMLLVFSSGAWLILLGSVLGAVATSATSRLLQEMLFQVKPLDPLTLAAGGMVLIVIASLATYLPARRATRVDPLVTLRYE